MTDTSPPFSARSSPSGVLQRAENGEPASIVELVDERAGRLDRVVLYDYLATGERWTFGELPARAGRVAGPARQDRRGRG